VSILNLQLKTISKSIRLPFLVLTPACLFLGWSMVIAGQQEAASHLFILSFIGGVLAHVSVNALNEYLDFESGLDLITKRTDFSGGSGALPENPSMAKTILYVGIISLVITVLIGVFFVVEYSWKIVPLGLAGAILIVAYTRWVNKHPLLCLVAPGIGFGLLMVLGANFALTGQYSSDLLLVSLIPFFLINNLLLLNQYPDIEADRKIGRNHFPIAFGISKSNVVYGLFILLNVVVILSAIALQILPMLSLITLLPLPLSLFSLSGAIKYRENIGQYPQYLGANVAVTIISLVLLSLSIVFG
jgi:1,4-dihydroxy-2-naphthoate octaprenyltransferase